MLSLGNKLSLTSSSKWHPTSEGSQLQMFYEYKTLGALDLPAVASWKDSSGQARTLLQEVTGSLPSYVASNGAVVFDGSNDFLSTSSALELSGAFTFAIKMNFAEGISNDTLLASNSENNNFIKVINNSSLNMKFSSSSALINFDSTIEDSSDIFFIITRDLENVVSVNINGDTQSDTVNRAGTFVIDTLGVRATNLNDFAGNIYEVQVYRTVSTRLTELIINRFNNI